MAARKPWTKDEYLSLREAFPRRYAYRWRCMLDIGVGCGFRISEIAAITLGDVLIEGDPARLRKEITIDPARLKGGKSREGTEHVDKVVDLVATLSEILRDELAEVAQPRRINLLCDRMAHGLINRRISTVKSRTIDLSPLAVESVQIAVDRSISHGRRHLDTPLLHSPGGKAVSRFSALRAIKRACRVTGLNATLYGTHSMRKTFAAMVLADLEQRQQAGDNIGNTLQHLQAALGHCKIDSTMAYVEHNRAALAETMQNVHNLLAGTKCQNVANTISLPEIVLPKYIKIQDAADSICVHRDTIKSEIRNGQIKTVTIAGKLRIAAVDWEEYIARCST